MRISRLMIVVGIVLIAAGAAANQISVGKPTKTVTIPKEELTFTDANPIWTYDLGALEKGAKIRLDSEDIIEPHILLVIRNTDTKNPVLDDRFKQPVQNTTFHIGGSMHYFTYMIPEDGRFEIEITKSPKPYFASFSLPWLRITMTFPPSYPYSTIGIVIAAVGILLIVVGIVYRKRG